MTKIEQSQSLTPVAEIELIEIDLTPLGGAALYICNDEHDDIVFNNVVYTSLPVELTGLAQTSEGAPNRPDLAISALDDDFNLFLKLYGLFQGAVVRRKKVFIDQLGLSNGESFGHCEFEIDSCKKSKTKVEFTLINKLDFSYKKLPARIFSQDSQSTATIVMRI